MTEDYSWVNSTTDDSNRWYTYFPTWDWRVYWKITNADNTEDEEEPPREVGDLGDYDFEDLPKEELRKWV